MRRAGVPLGDNRLFLLRPSLERIDSLERRLANEVAARRRVLRYVRCILEEELMYTVLTKQTREVRYDSRSRRVLVRDLEPFIDATFAELGGEPQGVSPPFVLYHGRVNEDEDGPVEVCVPRDDGEGSLPAGTVAFTEIRGEQCQFPQILGAYEAVYSWAHAHGHEPAGPPREIYVSGPHEELRMEIALPLS